ncbi:MAG: YetF domain-containing protein [Verrucomicrobiota bacterium]
MWTLSVPWWEFVFRAFIVYFFLLILLRLSGKRQIGQMSPFDLVLLLVLSNAVQNVINAGDNSILGGLISASTLILLNYGVGFATFKSKKIEAIVDGRPEVLIHNGHIFEDVMTRQQIAMNELEASIRAAGCFSIKDVHYAILENNGHISVKSK